MRFHQRIPFRVLVSFSLALLVLAPTIAEAQRRFGPYRPARTVVSLGFGWGWGYPYPYPAFRFYDPWFGYPFGPYQSPYFQPYGYGTAVGDLRLDVTPKQAEVYVDGYRAGIVDDFDGIFQRLRVRPGEHDLALYLPGYRTIVQHLYVNPGSGQRIRLTMVALKEGETAEAPPHPTASPQALAREPMRGGPPPMRGAQEPPRTTPAPEAARFGTLSIRVVPANADIWIDGERWRNPNATAPLVVQLSEGKHKIEIAHDNYERYASDVEIRAGETNSVNISLTKSK